MKTINLTFTKDRDTKNTVRFQEIVPDDDAQVIGALDVQKHAVRGASSIRVTLEIPVE